MGDPIDIDALLAEDDQADIDAELAADDRADATAGARADAHREDRRGNPTRIEAHDWDFAPEEAGDLLAPDPQARRFDRVASQARLRSGNPRSAHIPRGNAVMERGADSRSQQRAEDLTAARAVDAGQEAAPDNTFDEIVASVSDRGPALPNDDEFVPGAASRQFANMGTFGLADEMAGLAGGDTWDEYRDVRDANRAQSDRDWQENPGSSAVGALAGVAPTMLIPGATQAQAWRGAGTAGRIGLLAADGAAMGAVSGLGFSDANLAPGAERDFAGAALDTLEGGGIGAGTGAVLGSGTQGIPHTARWLATRRAANQGGADAAQLAERFMMSGDEAARAGRGMDALGDGSASVDDMQRFVSEDLAGPDLRRAAEAGERAGNEGWRGVSERMRRIEQDLDQIVAATNSRTGIGMKGEAVARLMQETPPPRGVMRQAAEIFDGVVSRLDEMNGRGEAIQGAGRAEVDDVLRSIRGGRRRGQDTGGLAHMLDDAMVNGDPGEVFMILDALKRKIGSRAGGRGSGPGIELLDGLYEELRGVLERPDLWGQGAAEMQTSLNAAFSSRLNGARSFDSRFLTTRDQRSSANKFRELSEPNDRALQGLLERDAGNPAVWEDQAFLTRGLEGRAELGSAIQRHMLGDGNTATVAARMQRDATEAAGLVSQARIDGTTAGLQRSLRNPGGEADHVNRAFKLIPDANTIAGLQRAAERAGESSPRLARALTSLASAGRRGPRAFAAAYYVLAQQNPELQEAIEQAPELADRADQ